MARRAYLVILIAMSVIISCNSDYSPNPAQLVEKAESCFSDGYIYQSCNKEYRLNQNGYVNVPFGVTDQFCYGPCLAETHRVLDCVERILPNFVFFNEATIKGIRATLQSGCGHSVQRGNFKLAQYIPNEFDSWSAANKLSNVLNIWFTSTLSYLVMLLGVYNLLPA